MHPAIDAAHDQTRALEHANMSRYSRQGHIKGLGKLGDPGRFCGQSSEQGAPGAVAEGAKNQVELVLGGIFRFGA